MKLEKILRRALSSGAAALVLAVPLTAMTPSASAAPAVSNCGSNAYVERIDVDPAAGPDYTIKLTPTSAAREAPGSWDVTVSMWHQVQSCVPGLYDQLADSIWQQLECHQQYPVEKWTGPTYDLETWRPPLMNPTAGTYVNTRCLNKKWIKGPENGSPGSGVNFPGYLDLANNVG